MIEKWHETPEEQKVIQNNALKILLVVRKLQENITLHITLYIRVSTIVILLTPEHFICAFSFIQKYVYILQSYSIDFPLSNCNTKDPMLCKYT